MEHNHPHMMTIRAVAKTGILTEHALRTMLKDGQLPVIYIGNRALINYDRLFAELSALKVDLTRKD